MKNQLTLSPQSIITQIRDNEKEDGEEEDKEIYGIRKKSKLSRFLKCLKKFFCCKCDNASLYRHSNKSSYCKNLNQHSKLLPDLRKSKECKLCLVVDLDETLVHSTFKYNKDAHFVVPVKIDTKTHQVYVLKRPHVDTFINEIGSLFECVLFTASLAKYADPVADLLDKNNTFSHRLFREACYNHKGVFIKNLDLLGRPLERVIIIDNSPNSYMNHTANALPIASWFGDPDDTELLKLLPFLKKLSECTNAMEELPKVNQQRELENKEEDHPLLEKEVDADNEESKEDKSKGDGVVERRKSSSFDGEVESSNDDENTNTTKLTHADQDFYYYDEKAYERKRSPRSRLNDNRQYKNKGPHYKDNTHYANKLKAIEDYTEAPDLAFPGIDIFSDKSCHDFKSIKFEHRNLKDKLTSLENRTRNKGDSHANKNKYINTWNNNNEHKPFKSKYAHQKQAFLMQPLKSESRFANIFSSRHVESNRHYKGWKAAEKGMTGRYNNNVNRNYNDNKLAMVNDYDLKDPNMHNNMNEMKNDTDHNNNNSLLKYNSSSELFDNNAANNGFLISLSKHKKRNFNNYNHNDPTTNNDFYNNVEAKGHLAVGGSYVEDPFIPPSLTTRSLPCQPQQILFQPPQRQVNKKHATLLKQEQLKQQTRKNQQNKQMSTDFLPQQKHLLHQYHLQHSQHYQQQQQQQNRRLSFHSHHKNVF